VFPFPTQKDAGQKQEGMPGGKKAETALFLGRSLSARRTPDEHASLYFFILFQPVKTRVDIYAL
jgi:hypothetical protein